MKRIAKLPFFRRAPAESAPEPEVGAGPPEGAPRVLVVDDDPEVRDLMKMALERGGFDVVGLAGDAGEAAALAEQEDPDIILLDLHMPDMGGLEVLPQLREFCPTAKFVVFSAIGATQMVEAALEAGAVGFIMKGMSTRSINLHLHRIAIAGHVKVVRPYPLNREYP